MNSPIESPQHPGYRSNRSRWIRSLFPVLCLLLLTAGPTRAQDAGQALWLDGYGDYMNIGGESFLSFGGSATYTIEAWIQPDTLRGTVISKFNGNVKGEYFVQLGDQGQLVHHREVQPFSHGTGTGKVKAGRYTHIAVSYDGVYSRIYVNGRLMSETDELAQQHTDGQTPVLVGSRMADGKPNVKNIFVGCIDEVRIWNRTLAPAEIEGHMHQVLESDAPGLIGYWNFDVLDADGRVPDLSGNGNHGVLQGDAHLADSYAPVYARPVTRVPQDQPTIQAGIDKALEGEVVLVDSGTYAGPGNVNISFGGKGIVVRGVAGAAETVIDVGEAAASGFRFVEEETESSVLEGFTIRHAGSSAIYIWGASPTIQGCVLESNQAGQGGGVYIAAKMTSSPPIPSSPQIRDTVIRGNAASYGGGGDLPDGCRPSAAGQLPDRGQ